MSSLRYSLSLSLCVYPYEYVCRSFSLQQLSGHIYGLVYGNGVRLACFPFPLSLSLSVFAREMGSKGEEALILYMQQQYGVWLYSYSSVRVREYVSPLKHCRNSVARMLNSYSGWVVFFRQSNLFTRIYPNASLIPYIFLYLCRNGKYEYFHSFAPH